MEAVQYRREPSRSTFESCVSTIKVLPLVKVKLTRSRSQLKISMFTVLVSINLSNYYRKSKNEDEKTHAVISSLISWIGRTQTLLSTVQVGMSGSPVGSNNFVTFGCSKSRETSKLLNEIQLWCHFWPYPHLFFFKCRETMQSKRLQKTEHC